MLPVTPSPSKSRDAVARVERAIIAALLGLVGVAASWWAGTWWWRAAHAEVASVPRPPIETADAPTPPHVEPRRALTPMLGTIRTTGRDAGAAEAAVPPERPTPTPVSHGWDQGHGSERWRGSGALERADFEPRYSLDGGTLAEPPPVVAEAPGAFH